MEFRQVARCAYRAATKPFPSVLGGSSQLGLARPSPLFSSLGQTRLISSNESRQDLRPSSNPPGPGTSRKGNQNSLPPRPPATSSPWSRLDSSSSSVTTPASSSDSTSPAPLKDASDLPSLIRWDVSAFMQRNNLSAGPPPPMRLRPTTGRTIHRSANADVARCFQLLNRAVAINKVKADFNRQRFHERPGLKRKRLKSERWRKRFKQGFRAMLTRVTELRNQGW